MQTVKVNHDNPFRITQVATHVTKGRTFNYTALGAFSK